jgi:hypothetical protein
MDDRVAKCLKDYDESNNPHAKIQDVCKTKLNKPMDVSIEDAKIIYDACISLFQSNKSKKGKTFERIIEDMFADEGVPFLSQGHVATNGMIVHNKRGQHGIRKPDFILDAKIGDSIQDKTIVSTKLSLRERKNQDINIASKCKRVYLLSANKDDERQASALQQHNMELYVVGGSPTRNMDAFLKSVKETWKI